MGSGRYLVAGSQVPGTKSAEGEGEREGGGGLGWFPRDGRPQITIKLGRQTAERRIGECRVLSTASSWVRFSWSCESKGNDNRLSRDAEGGAQQ